MLLNGYPYLVPIISQVLQKKANNIILYYTYKVYNNVIIINLIN